MRWPLTATPFDVVRSDTAPLTVRRRRALRGPPVPILATCP